MQKYVILLVVLSGLVFTVFTQEFKLITPIVLDMGTVLEDSIVTGKIRFTNSGNLPLKIGRIQTSCGCTVAQLDKLTYLPNEEGEIAVQFNTKGQAGLTRKTVNVSIEEGTPSSVRVTLQTIVKQQLEINPAFIDLQDITLKDSSIKRSLVIKNNYNQDLLVKNIKGNIKSLTVKPEQFLLHPGSEKALEILYQPQKEGRNDGYIEIEFEKPVQKLKRIPVFIKVNP
ncbi:MAG: hypothetical protein A2Y94_10535 [Caldithrix sp. RBG_13_44_9]|nr:MAG: hypothetical protein A2Y94_10535 [Caldithrix sp. RBG_13_44_9]